MENIIHNAEFHPINNSSNFTNNWTNLCPLLHGHVIMEGLDKFELPEWKVTCWEEFKKIPEAMSKDSAEGICHPCLGNSPWNNTLPISLTAIAASLSSKPLCKGGVWPVVSHKICCRNGICSKRLCYWLAGFTRDVIVNFHNTCVRGDEIPHITVTSRHKHRFSISVWEGVLAYQSLGPVVLPDRLTGSLHPWVLLNDLSLLFKMHLFISNNICGSCMVGHLLIFSALSDNIGTGLLVDNG
jgi:hypothetical protein